MTFIKRTIVEASHTTGYIADGDDKIACREALVASAKALYGTPRTIFTLAGRHCGCVKLFREHWTREDTRIVSIDRHKDVVRGTPVEKYGMEQYFAPFRDYVSRSIKRGATKILRDDSIMKNASFEPHPRFDFPLYDLAFLDNNHNPTDEHITDVVEFIVHHTACRAVIGVTFTAGAKSDINAPMAEDIANRLIGRCPVPLSLAYRLDYTTGSKMVFFVLVRDDDAVPAGRILS